METSQRWKASNNDILFSEQCKFTELGYITACQSSKADYWHICNVTFSKYPNTVKGCDLKQMRALNKICQMKTPAQSYQATVENEVGKEKVP